MGFFFHCKFYKNNFYSIRYKVGKHKYNIKKITAQAIRTCQYSLIWVKGMATIAKGVVIK